MLGVIGGGVIGACIGAVIGYGVGYLAGGTYTNGLAAKSINSGVKSFMSQMNKVHHVIANTEHKLSNYTVKAVERLIKKTLIHGTVDTYKTVQSAYLAASNSEVTFTTINGVLKISDMWIRSR